MDMKKQMVIAMTLSLALGISTLLPASVVMADSGSGSGSSTSVSAASQARGQFSAQQIAALNYVNEVRAKVGLPSVQLNSTLNKAAFNHARYAYWNNSLGNDVLNSQGVPTAHYEVKGKPYFTGVDVVARVNAAGNLPLGSSTEGEVMAPSPWNTTEPYTYFVTSWLDAPLHRELLLFPSMSYIGISVYRGVAVLDFATYDNPPLSLQSLSVTYPYNGQQNVPVSYAGDSEIPDPLAPFNVAVSGYPISVNAPSSMAATVATVQDYHFVLKDSKGNVVPVFENFDDDGYALFFPKQPLQYNETYTVSVNVSGHNQLFVNPPVETWSKTWSFTTQAPPSPTVEINQFGDKPQYPAQVNGKPIGKLVCTQEQIVGTGTKLYKYPAGTVFVVTKMVGSVVGDTQAFLTREGWQIYPGTDGTVFYEGTLYSPDKPLVTYNANGTVYKVFKPGQKFAVQYQLGAWYYIGNHMYVPISDNVVYQPLF